MEIVLGAKFKTQFEPHGNLNDCVWVEYNEFIIWPYHSSVPGGKG